MDYGLVSPDLYDQVPVFSVLPPDPSVSDHSPIALYLKVNSFVSYAESNDNLLSKPQKINWDSKIRDRYTNLIKSDECKAICSSFLETGIKPDQSSVDAAVKLLSDIMIETAQKSDLSLTAPVSSAHLYHVVLAAGHV